MSELIAEARVLVTPDTTQFRSLLVAQTAAATKGVTVPVQVAPVVTNAGAASQAAQVAGAKAAAQSAQAITRSSITAAAAQNQLARAADLVAIAERRAAAATTEVSAAQVRYRAQISATAVSFKAYQSALQTSDLLLVKQARDAYAAAKANEALALSNLNTARSEVAKTTALSKGATAQAASLSQLSRGAGGAGLAMLGLRGATLAATGPFLAGAAALTGFAKSLQTATSFNSEIAVLGATTGATAEQLETAAAAAREFGRDITLPGVTAGDAAKTITEFAKAGLSLNQSIAATRGGLQLAQAAQLSYEDAVQLSANALNAFNLSGTEAVRVADTLANAANFAQGGIEETAFALRQSAGAAAVVGVSFRDTIALLAQLARNGLTGSDAGTALRTSFIKLVNPSDEAQEKLRDLNLTLRDVNGNVRPEIFAEFAAAHENLGRAAFQSNAALVFGQDAFRAIGLLGREGAAGLIEARNAMDETGTAARIAGARMTGLRGSAENLSNQMGSLGLTIGEKATPAVKFLVDELAEVAAAANDAIAGIEDLKRALEDLPGGPSEGEVSRTFGFLRDSFVEGLELTQPAFRFIKAFKDGADDTSDAAANAGAEIRSSIEDAGRNAARGAVDFGDQITRAIDDSFARIDTTLAQVQRNLRAAAIRSIGQSGGQAAGLAEQFDAILAGGGTLREQIASLQRQAQVQATIIRTAGPNAAGVVLEARREAQAELARINQQIVSLEGQIAADQKQAQDAAQRVREEAQRERDRSFLQAQEDARTSQERRITFAEDTPALTDDIRQQTALQALIQKQIAALKQSALEEKTKQAAIRALKAERDRTTDDLRRLRDANKALQAEQKQAARDQISENLELRTQIAEAQGNEDAVLVALNNQIKDQQKRVAAYKKGTTEFLKEKLALEQMLQQRRELLETAKDEGATGGTTLVDLFNRAREILSGAGNVGQTADSLRAQSASTQIKATVQQKLDIVNDPVKAAAERQAQSTNNLIQAIDRLTAVLTGNTASGTPITRREQNQWKGLTDEQRFYYQRQAKQMVEQGLMG